MDLATAEMHKTTLGLAVAAVVLLSIFIPGRYVDRLRANVWARVGLGVLVASTIAYSITIYYREDWSRASSRVDGYDVLHYYVNAKYFSQLKYDRLYECALAADAQQRRPRWKQIERVRRLSDYRVLSASEVLTDQNTKRCEEELGGEKSWRAFRADVQAIGVHVHRSEAQRLFTDRGFNGTPSWMLMGSALAHAVSAEHITWLTKVDLLFLGGAVVMVGWAYGVLPALWVLLTFFLLWASRWPNIGTAYLRYDWVSALICAMCLLKKEKFYLAGVAAAWAAGARLFPAALPALLGLKALTHLAAARDLPWRRRVPPRYVKFFGAFLGTLLALTLAVAATWGTDTFRLYAANMKVHVATEHLSTQRVGLAMALVYRGEMDTAELNADGGFVGKRHMVEEVKRPVLALAMLLGLLAAFVVPRRDDDEVFAAGTILFFVAVVASYYYYVILLCLAVWHVSRLEQWRHRLNLSALLAVNAIVPYLDQTTKERYVAMAWFSWALLGYFTCVVLTLLVFTKGSRLPETTAEAPSDTSTPSAGDAPAGEPLAVEGAAHEADGIAGEPTRA